MWAARLRTPNYGVPLSETFEQLMNINGLCREINFQSAHNESVVVVSKVFTTITIQHCTLPYSIGQPGRLRCNTTTLSNFIKVKQDNTTRYETRDAIPLGEE
jgi:hypothetical protein